MSRAILRNGGFTALKLPAVEAQVTVSPASGSLFKIGA